MILYLAIGAFVAGLTFGGWGMGWWKDGVAARKDQANAEAQAHLQAQVDKAKADAANKLIDMAAAYDAGESKAKVIYRTIEAKGQQYVATVPVFSNPQCVVPPDIVSELNGARAALRSAPDTGKVDASVPAAGAPAKR